MKAVDGRRVVSDEYDHYDDEYCLRYSRNRPYKKGVSEGQLKGWCAGFTYYTDEFMTKKNAIITLRKSVLPKKVEDMKKTSAMSKLRKSILPKKVQDWKKKNQAAIVEEVPPVQATSEPKQETINTPPAAPEPEETTEEPLAVPEPDSLTIEEPLAAPKPGLEIISNLITIMLFTNIETKAAPKPDLKILAVPKPTLKIIYESPALPEPDPPLPAPGTSDTIQDTTEVQDRARPRIKRKTYRPNVKYKDVEHLLATTEGDHQLVASEGGKIYWGMTGWLRGCVGILQRGQPTGISDVLAIGRLGIG